MDPSGIPDIPDSTSEIAETDDITDNDMIDNDITADDITADDITADDITADDITTDDIIADDITGGIANPDGVLSDSDDNAPEEIGLSASRKSAAEKRQAIQESVGKKEAVLKDKRKQIEVKNKKQKNKKLRKERRREEAIKRKLEQEKSSKHEKSSKPGKSSNILMQQELDRLPEHIIAELSDTPIGDGINESSGLGNKKIVFSGDEDIAGSIADNSDNFFNEDSGFSESSAGSRKSKIQAVNLLKLRNTELSEDVVKFLHSRFQGGTSKNGKRFRRTKLRSVDIKGNREKGGKQKQLTHAQSMYTLERDGLIKKKKTAAIKKKQK